MSKNPFDKENPSNRQEASKPRDAKRIPMSVPTRKLEVGEIPGFHLHWFLGKYVNRALQGGYEFVSTEEVATNQIALGASGSISGSADLGSKVSVISGEGEHGKTEVLYLMKIRQEWWEEDQKTLGARNKQIELAIKGGQIGAGQGDDARNRYLKSSDLTSSRSPISKS